MNTQEWVKRIEQIKADNRPNGQETHEQLRQRYVNIARLETLRAELRLDTKALQTWADALALHCNAHPFI